MAINTDDVIKVYIQLRDKLEAEERRQKDELAPLKDRLRKLEIWLQNQLQSQGLTNVKSESGTAYLQGVSSVSVQDWESTLKHVRENNQWELLDRRVSKSVVEDYIEEHGEAPPGIHIQRQTVVRIRRG